jgi:hypothetical protein
MQTNKFTLIGCCLVLSSALFVGTSSCRRGSQYDDAPQAINVRSLPELQRNRLGSMPGAIYQGQAASPVNWQPWSKETVELAKKSGRLLFCFVATPQQTEFIQVLKSLAGNAAIVSLINDSYVPVLIDADASREIGILSADLCQEIKKPVHLPLFMWMSHDRNPVGWIPVSARGIESASDVFIKSHEMISQMWQGSRDYVLKNSALDNADRRARMSERRIKNASSPRPDWDTLGCIRQVVSLYDPMSGSLDEAGGVFPSSSLELFATAARQPGLPADLRRKCARVTSNLLDDLLPSAMFDPLDGGLYCAKSRISWGLPRFTRDCPSQAKGVVALIEAYRTSGDRRALNKAVEIIEFAEKSFMTRDGLFAFGLAAPIDQQKWMWTVEEVKEALGAEDSAWWIKATGMNGIGNLLPEDDPDKICFRNNTLGMNATVEEIAAGKSLDVEKFRPRYETAKAKLLTIREARMNGAKRDDCPHAGATFRMVSAYAAMYTVTGEKAYRDKAVALLKRSREAFSVGPKLRLFDRDATPSIGEGRAFLYALGLLAVLDVAAITLDESWYIWSEDLATTSTELFTGKGFLKECPDEGKLIDLPVTDLTMLFDDSTCGLMSLAESRISGLNRSLVASFSGLLAPLPTYAMERPLLHTDLVLAMISRHFKVSVICDRKLPDELAHAVQRLPLRVMHRRFEKNDEEVPSNSVRIVLADGTERVVRTPEELRLAVLPIDGQ